MSDWPESMVGADGAITPAESAEFTVMVSPGEHCEDVAESLTLTEYAAVAAGEAEKVELVAPLTGVVQAA